MAKHDDAPQQAAPGLTSADLIALAAAITGMQPKTPLEMSGLSPEAQRALSTPPPASEHTYRRMKAKGENGDTFTIIVVPSKAHKNGRIVRVEDYRFPEGIYKSVANGGIVPDGMPVRKNGTKANGEIVPREECHILYLHWRTTEFYVPANKRYVGKGLQPSDLVNEADIAMPWADPSLNVTDDAADAAE